MATQLATREDNPIAKLNNQLAARADQFKMVLPAHITPEKLQRTVMTAVQSDPDLLSADRQSLMTACMKAAQDGLLPDKREAALVIFKENKKVDNQWVTRQLVQYMPMVYGLRKKILQSDEISTLETNVVYRAEVEREAFIFEAGTEAMLRHRPLLDLTDEETSDDQIIAAYSVAVMKDGSKSFEVMRRSEINKVREKSQTGATRDRKGQPRNSSGPWVDWFGEMARKTVMRRHSKTLPMSGDILDNLDRFDDELAARSTTAVLGAVAPDAPQISHTTPPTRDDVANDERYDETTGEVIREGDDESEEDAARRLDAEQSAQERGLGEDTITEESPNAEEGRAEADHGDQHDGADDADPRAKLVARLVNEIGTATTLPAIKKSETEFLNHRAAMADEHVSQIEAMIVAARKRVRGDAAE